MSLVSRPDDDYVTDLALKAGRGDRAALNDFIALTQDDVWRLLAHLAGREYADDLTQETYLRVLKSLPRFAGRSSARTWLLSLARRTWVDSVRHDMARPRKSAAEYEDVAAEQPSPDSASTWSEVMDADAFAAFEETGDAFDPATAGRLERSILSQGGARPADELWHEFRGRRPGVEPLLRGRGLA